MFKKSCFKLFAITVLMFALGTLSAYAEANNLDQLNGTWQVEEGFTFTLDSASKTIKTSVLGEEKTMDFEVVESSENKVILNVKTPQRDELTLFTIIDNDNILLGEENDNLPFQRVR